MRYSLNIFLRAICTSEKNLSVAPPMFCLAIFFIGHSLAQVGESPSDHCANRESKFAERLIGHSSHGKASANVS
jgi:hypothetical protein